MKILPTIDDGSPLAAENLFLRIESNRKNKTIERFLAGEGDEIEVVVKNVLIEDLRTPPYKATVDFEKVYLTRSGDIETKRERYVRRAAAITTADVNKYVVKRQEEDGMRPCGPLIPVQFELRSLTAEQRYRSREFTGPARTSSLCLPA
jgi:hypothetical protein